MKETKLNNAFWDKRYQENETGWDIGYASTPLKTYFDQKKIKTLKILIPGCGNAYEAEYLWGLGFKNLYLLDYSSTALKNFKNRNADFPEKHLICQNFFDHKEQYDLIIEQTFFCAIEPSLRKKYVQKMRELLYPDGKLIGLLFNDPLNQDKPPFGGNKEEYEDLFSPYFKIIKLEPAYNSIEARAGRELFINFALIS